MGNLCFYCFNIMLQESLQTFKTNTCWDNGWLLRNIPLFWLRRNDRSVGSCWFQSWKISFKAGGWAKWSQIADSKSRELSLTVWQLPNRQIGEWSAIFVQAYHGRGLANEANMCQEPSVTQQAGVESVEMLQGWVRSKSAQTSLGMFVP